MSAIRGSGGQGPLEVGPTDASETAACEPAGRADPAAPPSDAAAPAAQRGGASGDAFRARIVPQAPAPGGGDPRAAAILGDPGMTALQKHAAFFDLDGDGTVTVKETDRAMRMLGLAGTTSTPVAFAINVGLGNDTSGRLLDVSVGDIHKGIHEGDTGVFDARGHVVPAKLDELWARFDVDADGALTIGEIDRMIETNNGGAGLSKGVLAARGEFYLLLDLAGTKNDEGEKVITKETLARFYDGSLFFDLASARAAQAARVGADPHVGEVARGLPGLARTLGGIVAGSGAGAWLGNLLTFGQEEPARNLAAPLSSAMLAVCPQMSAAAQRGAPAAAGVE